MRRAPTNCLVILTDHLKFKQTDRQTDNITSFPKGPSTIIIVYFYDNSYHNSLTPSPPPLTIVSSFSLGNTKTTDVFCVTMYINTGTINHHINSFPRSGNKNKNVFVMVKCYDNCHHFSTPSPLLR